MMARCIDCGLDFWRDDAEDWKRRCLPCWRKRRDAHQREHVGPPQGNAQLCDELAANLPALLQLVHPDRHDGSPLANRVTQWLLDVRRRVREELAA